MKISIEHVIDLNTYFYWVMRLEEEFKTNIERAYEDRKPIYEGKEKFLQYNELKESA